MASSAAFDIQLVDKDNVTQQCIETIHESASKPLPLNTIRTQTALIGLTANNVSYAEGGRTLKWWDTYPVPTDDVAKAAKFGLVPGWGFAKIIASNVPTLEAGQLLWGYWPFHKAPVDLQLQRHDYKEPVGGFDGFWRETSPHRQGLMGLYNRYFAFQGTMSGPQRELDAMAWRASLAVWESGYLYSEFNFPTAERRAAGHQVHPFGLGGAWTPEQADPTQTAMVAFGGSSKVAMSLASFMRQRAANDRFASMVGVASAQSKSQVQGSGLFDEVIEYGEISDSSRLSTIVASLASRHKRLILLDITSRGNALMTFYEAAAATGIGAVEIIKVGAAPQRDDKAAEKAGMARLQEVGYVQANASAIRDEATSKIGEGQYAKEADEAFVALLARGGLPGSTLKWGRGVRGPDGVEGGWQRMCSGQVAADEALVYTL